MLEAGISIAQPDLSHAGAISEVRRIASLAEVFGAHLAPHCPLGPIASAASLQVDFAIPNFLIQEQSLDIHDTQGNALLDYLVDSAVFAFKDGFLDHPTAPGLGIEVDEAAVRQADEKGHRWRRPSGGTPTARSPSGDRPSSPTAGRSRWPASAQRSSHSIASATYRGGTMWPSSNSWYVT